uniref:nucleoside-diphosphate kinase n=1 Tax=Parascaris univalens TaxID=6257 RepID=A0A915B0M9_PARUN
MSTAAKVSAAMWKALCRCRRNKVKEEEIAIANTTDFASTATGEKTVVIFAAAVIQRALVGKLIERIERRNLSLDGIKMLSPTNEMLQIHFKGKSTTRNQKAIAERIETMVKSPIVVTIWRGIDAVKVCASACSELRHQFALDSASLTNSENTQQARKDIACWFRLEEISSIQPQLKTNIESGMEEVDEEQQQTANIPATVHNATETPAPVEVRREGTKEEAASKEVADQSPIQEPNANDSKYKARTNQLYKRRIASAV